MEAVHAESTTMPAIGTKISYELGEEKSSSSMTFEKRYKYYWEAFADDDDDDGAVESTAAVGTKRRYKRNEEKSDVIFEKRYKCNYWEDPASAWKLKRWGSRFAQMDALENHCERSMPEAEMVAWNAARAASDHR